MPNASLSISLFGNSKTKVLILVMNPKLHHTITDVIMVGAHQKGRAITRHEMDVFSKLSF